MIGYYIGELQVSQKKHEKLNPNVELILGRRRIKLTLIQPVLMQGVNAMVTI